MPMNVFIYDPTASTLDHVRGVIQSEMAANRWDAWITALSSSTESLAAIGAEKFDIAFINMFDKVKADGITSAFRICNPDAAVVFTGGSVEGLALLLKYNPAEYISDVSDTDRLKTTIYKIYNSKWLNSRYYIITTRNGVERVPHMAIEYFESDNRKVVVHRSHRQLSVFYATLNEVQEKLKDDVSFVRCHQSFLVNLDNVQSINYKEKCFVMKSGFPVFISRRNYAEVKERIGQYAERRRKG